MQRMLAVLVVLLIAAVGALGIVVLSLSDRVGSGTGDRSASVRSTPRDDEVEAQARAIADLKARIAGQDGRIAELRRDLAGAAAREAGRASGSDGAGPSGDSNAASPLPSPNLANDPRRDPSGAWTFTEEQIEYAAALQKEVERRKRLDGMVRSALRRIDGLAAKGTIAPVQDVRRTQVEGVLRKYLVQADELVQSSLRTSEGGDAGGTQPEERREFLIRERERLTQEVRSELVPLVGERDAGEVAESTLMTSYLPRLARAERPARNR